MTRKTSLLCLIVAAGLVSSVLLGGCGKDSDSKAMNVTANEQVKAARAVVANVRRFLAKPEKAQEYGGAVSNLSDVLSTLPNWIDFKPVGDVEAKKKAVVAAKEIVDTDVTSLVGADPIDLPKINAKLDEVDKLLAQAE